MRNNFNLIKLFSRKRNPSRMPLKKEQFTNIWCQMISNVYPVYLFPADIYSWMSVIVYCYQWIFFCVCVCAFLFVFIIECLLKQNDRQSITTQMKFYFFSSISGQPTKPYKNHFSCVHQYIDHTSTSVYFLCFILLSIQWNRRGHQKWIKKCATFRLGSQGVRIQKDLLIK